MNSQIESRKVKTTITLLDSNGLPLANHPVTAAQTRHKFLFGTAAFDTVPLANGEYSGKELEQAQIRADKLTGLFNSATLPFYWGRFEPQQGRPHTEQLKRAALWCVDHKLTVKGHPLTWHTICADWLLPLSNAEILHEQKARIRREVGGFKGLIDMWDVINEAVIMPVFDKYDNGLTRICKEMGRIPLIRTVFETARAENPEATFLINDFDMSDAYDILVEGCLEAGIKIDAIGLQSHMHQGYWGVEKTQKILERFSRFNLPLHFTETTLVSGRLMPPEIVDLNDYQVTDWPTTPEGEERQAIETITHYETLFAHPLVQSITWWDMVDGNWLNAPGGLVRRDGSAKPAYDELMKRIKGEWWLSPVELITDDSGKVTISGFPGEYELSVNGENRKVILDKGTEQANIRL
jgi:GH35 family endo-1,4-beta-xylanase